MSENNNQGTTNEASVEKKERKTDKRKQSFYLPEDVVNALQVEADRLDRSLSWVVQRCCKLAIPEVRELPSMSDTEGE